MSNDVRELADAMQRFSDKIDAFTHHTSRNENRSAVTINAGGVGVWIAATCCAVMLAANVFLAAFVLDLKNEMRDQARRISDLDAYLSAIYMQAPHLKPPEKKE